MELKRFSTKVKKAIGDRMGEGYHIEIQEVQKNNGVMLQGLLIHAKEQNVSPTIYLNSFWEAYERGIPFAVIIEKILSIYEEDTPKENVDMSFFKDFNQVKERVCYRLISAERNKELLAGVPHVEYLDLAICFFYAYQGEVLGNGSILIHNSHMEMWKTNTDTLYEWAQKNTPELFPEEWNSMENVIRDLMEEQHGREMEEFLSEEEQNEFFEQLPLQILSNECRVHGAACILYPGLLEQQALIEGRNLYIIPSSIHELIVLPDSGRENAERLQEMIVEVNATQVDPEEILSNNLYYFNRLTGQLKIV
uniref:DUF5688 family protein n=1 Tax=Acetatifactor sp. TaxID=1872090 RepID=UPI0040576240